MRSTGLPLVHSEILFHIHVICELSEAFLLAGNVNEECFIVALQFYRGREDVSADMEEMDTGLWCMDITTFFNSNS